MEVDGGRAGVLAHPLAGVAGPALRVMPLDVFDDLELLLGLVGAVAAEEGVLVGVGQVMVAQAGCPAESPPAGVADVGLLLAVLLQVGLEEEAGLEGLAALLADEGSGLPVPCLLVHPQGVRPVGAVLALVAAVRLQACGGREGDGTRTRGLFPPSHRSCHPCNKSISSQRLPTIPYRVSRHPKTPHSQSTTQCLGSAPPHLPSHTGAPYPAHPHTRTCCLPAAGGPPLPPPGPSVAKEARSWGPHSPNTLSDDPQPVPGGQHSPVCFVMWYLSWFTHLHL